MRFCHFVAFALLLFLTACQRDKAQQVEQKASSYFDFKEEGFASGGIRMIPVETPAGTFKVWTKRFGNNPAIKVLLLHGGPAITHEYFESFESFLPKEGIEFYYYDQLGSYYSDQPKDSSLWTLDRYVEEVEQVRKGLGLNNTNCYVLGQSWGGILAMQYALKYQDSIKGLIISNMMPSFTGYGSYNEKLRAELRPTLLDSLLSYEKEDKFFDPVYQEIVLNEFYTRHICRMPAAEWPDPVKRTFKHINSEIYVMMQGPSEFVPGGRLTGWDVTAQLKNIHIPTLAIGARYDTMDPEAMEMISKTVQHGTYLYCPEGSHLCFWDDQQHYFPGLISFLKK
jgi:proline iminopeptidase